jgi:hypothetical protein
VDRFSVYPRPTHAVSPYIDILRQSAVSELMNTSLSSTVHMYVRTHSWVCTIDKLGQMYNDMCALLCCITQKWFVLFCDAGDQTQGLECARQVLYH